MTTLLITGAAGNLGSRFARHLAGSGHDLRLMVHKTPLPGDLGRAEGPEKVTVVRADLARPETLRPAVRGADVVVHFAGVLFAPGPERFLPVTNTRWFSNLVDACLEEKVRRIVLISFPHVEGPTTVDTPATGRLDRLDGEPVSVHAATRLEEERLLFERTRGTETTPVSLRLGMVYGRGILMIDAARWLSRHRLLAVWREPSWIHLVSTADFLRATEAATLKPGVEGIYHVGDEQPITLQDFLARACAAWGTPPPKVLPLWMIYTAAWLCETFARLTGRRSPLTRDFITIGRVSYWGDTGRAREDLVPTLEHPTLESGIETL